ncbi:MAG: single-stranded DNA-binding protein [Tenuifilaceae bacterium]|jgi:single-strand DNA-binding protein
MSVNKVILVGNVGKDPDVRHLDSGVTVARFSLATNETFTDKTGKRVTQTEWHNIVVWRGLADVAEKYVRSGKLLFVEGRLRTSSYEDKEGHKKYTTEILCDNFRFLGPAQGSDAGQAKTSETLTTEPQGSMPEPDDLPF